MNKKVRKNKANKYLRTSFHIAGERRMSKGSPARQPQSREPCLSPDSITCLFRSPTGAAGLLLPSPSLFPPSVK